jgi:parallel beta-helix repeat protein
MSGLGPGRSVGRMRLFTRGSWQALGIALILGGVAATVPSDALARQVGCGDTIVRDTTLHRNLTDCPDNGLVIGAAGLTLDLNGHTIDGDAAESECQEGAVCDVGVDNHTGYDRLAIVGGTIREFSLGVLVDGSTGTRVMRTTLADNAFTGLVMVNSRRSLVAQNSASGSNGYVMFLDAVDDSVIEHNALANNDHGIALFGASARNVVRRNVVSHNRGAAIDLGNGSALNRIDRNRLVANGDGIIGTEVHDNLISGNVVAGTGFFGFPDTGGFGIILDGADHNTLNRNVVTGGRGPAIFVTQLDAPTAAEHNVLTRNVVNSRLDDGIHVDGGTTGTVLERNAANRSGDDGIDVDAAATTLTRNRADRNGDLGIEAVAGVTDGGGNRARGNGNPLQCTNLACSGR